MIPSYEFYDKPGYIAELTRSAQEAGDGDQLTAMAMTFDASNQAIAAMAEAFAAAAKRGASVRLIIDAMSFMLDDDERLGPILVRGKIVPERLCGSFRLTYEALEQLKANGGSYHILNMPDRAFRYPYASRTHIKLAIVNDRLFIGGCNLDDTNRLDIMTAWHNRPTVDAVQHILDDILANGTVRDALESTDQTLVLGELARLYIDCGIRNQSIILRNAHQLIDDAKKKLIITCQYFPGGETGRRLLAAKRRGVDVKIYFSHPSTHGRMAFIHYIYNSFERLRLPRDLFKDQMARDIAKLHAKVIISESAAMIGSHNYVAKGVEYGTAEIALYNEDKQFIEQLQTQVDQLVKPA